MAVAAEHRPWAEDVVLLLGLGVITFLRPVGALTLPLSVAIVLALVWGCVTLHTPTRVEVTSERILLSRYGRTHAFEWSHVERIRLRRFLVKDRVLLRLTPSSPWSGRYWLRDSLDGYEVLLSELEKRARVSVESTGASELGGRRSRRGSGT